MPTTTQLIDVNNASDPATDGEAVIAQIEVAERETTPMVLLKAAVEQGTIDTDKLAALMEMQHRWEQRRDAKAYGEALMAFQGECPRVKKRRAVSFDRDKVAYKFAAYEDIMAVIAPVLRKHGLSVSFDTRMPSEGVIEATCYIRHGIHREAHSVTMPVPSGVNVNDTQKTGMALSYAKRYALTAALNIVVEDEDNDANGLLESVSADQAMKIEAAIEETEGDKGRFLHYYKVNSFTELPASQFDEIMATIREAHERREANK